MEAIKALILLILLTGCGDTRYYNVLQNADEQGRSVFSGYYMLDGASSANCVYLDEKIPNVVDLESDCQSLVTINPQNNTIGQFPVIAISNMIVVNNEINYTRNINYTSGHDLEEDVSGANITGQRRTDFRFHFDDNVLTLEIKTYKAANNSNLNEIVAVRTFKEL